MSDETKGYEPGNEPSDHDLFDVQSDLRYALTAYGRMVNYTVTRADGAVVAYAWARGKNAGGASDWCQSPGKSGFYGHQLLVTGTDGAPHFTVEVRGREASVLTPTGDPIGHMRGRWSGFGLNLIHPSGRKGGHFGTVSGVIKDENSDYSAYFYNGEPGFKRRRWNDPYFLRLINPGHPWFHTLLLACPLVYDLTCSSSNPDYWSWVLN